MELLENKYSELAVSEENIFTQMIKDNVQADETLKKVEKTDVYKENLLRVTK